MTDEEYNKYNKPKKKYTFEEHRNSEDRKWSLDRQRKHDEEGKKIIRAISNKHATIYQIKQQEKLRNAAN